MALFMLPPPRATPALSSRSARTYCAADPDHGPSEVATGRFIRPLSDTPAIAQAGLILPQPRGSRSWSQLRHESAYS
jgi:hypothetical protein